MKTAVIIGAMILGVCVPTTAKNLRSVGLTAAQTRLKIAKMQQQTQRQAIAASRATARENAALRSKQIDSQRDSYRRATATSRYGYTRGYRSGYSVISSLRIRRRGLRSRVRTHH